MEIRPLKAMDDLNLIVEIYVQNWKHAYREIIPEAFLVRLASERWVTILKDNPFQSFVLLEQG